MGKHTKYLNGLAVVSIVFITLATIPLGIVTGLASVESDYNENTTTLESGDYLIIDVEGKDYYFIQYYVHADYDVKVSAYFVENYNYDVISTIEDYENTKTVKHDEILYGSEKTTFAIYLINENEFTISVYTLKITTPKVHAITALVFGVIDIFFLTILILHTVGYILKNLIIVPISGGAKYDDRRSSRERERYEDRRRTERNYYPQQPKAIEDKGDKVVSTPSTSISTQKNTQPLERSKEKIMQKQEQDYIPAIANISENFVVAEEPKTYPHKNQYINSLHYYYDQTDIAERVLVLLSIFFFLIGCFTASYWNIFAMPILLGVIAAIVAYNSRNRRDKLIKIVEGYGAIYVRDATRLLNSSYRIVQQDIWKIIKLGQANIAYDLKNDILFIPGIQNSEQAKKAKTEHLTRRAKFPTYQPLKEEEKSASLLSTEKITKEDLICPFCEAKNPDDSSFCIKCGASLKPAK